MRRAPPILSKVRFHGARGVGPCTGSVVAQYRSRDDAGELLPEHEWYVTLLVDQAPVPWPYGSARKFAARVEHLSVLPAVPTLGLPYSRSTNVRETFQRALQRIGAQRPGPRLVLEVDVVAAA